MESNTPTTSEHEIPSFIFKCVCKEKDHTTTTNQVKVVLEGGFCGISHLRLKQLPKKSLSMFSMYIQHLNISHNLLVQLPEDIFDVLSSVITLDISYNQLHSIPKNLDSLTNLVEINASCNQIRYLPEAIIQMDHIKTMDLWGNPLSPGWANYCYIRSFGNSIPDIFNYKKEYEKYFLHSGGEIGRFVLAHQHYTDEEEWSVSITEPEMGWMDGIKATLCNAIFGNHKDGDDYTDLK